MDETHRSVPLARGPEPISLALIRAGCDGILSMGAYGECATLTWEEKMRLMATLVESARGRVPVFVGTTTLNTRDTIMLTRLA